jgi:hypothetical protein
MKANDIVIAHLPDLPCCEKGDSLLGEAGRNLGAVPFCLGMGVF